MVSSVRDIISDYALPAGVIISTIIGHFIVEGVYREYFANQFHYIKC